MTYRDELHAAQLRIAALEEELVVRQVEIEKLRQTQTGTNSKWILAAVLLATLGWAGLSETTPNSRVQALEIELEDVRSEAMLAREEGRAALEALRQHAESRKTAQRVRILEDDDGPPPPPRLDPSDPLATSTVEVGSGDAVLWVDSEPSSDLIIDGKRYGKTPLMVRVPPGGHALMFSHPQRGVRTRTVTARAGETLRVSARLDGKEP